MATINDIYVFAASETSTAELEVTDHPVESGINLTDHARKTPVTLSITGSIAGADYEDDVEEIKAMQENAEFVTYEGKHYLDNCIITSFSTSADQSLRDGVSFEMELKEVRIASSPYTAVNADVGLQQIVQTIENAIGGEKEQQTYEVKAGDTMWKIASSFLGSGAKYVDIVAQNPQIRDPNVLSVGEKIVMPSNI